MSELNDKTTVLVIDDSLMVRQSVRAMLGNVDITRSEMCTNAADALSRLKSKQFDVVLCDYHLGEGMNGQELLEQLRGEGGIPLTTVWIMITGERSYERVVAAAEVAPDDYILKPFSSQMLLDRMQQAFQRKFFLRPAHDALMDSREKEAIPILESLIPKADTMVKKLDVLRLLAETHLALEQYDAAARRYREIMQLRVIPWAKMGMARILHAQDKAAESADLLQEIIQDAPHYTDAYDTLAHNLARCGQFAESLDVLERAIAMSPRNFRRLCLAGESALNAGDPAKAAQFLEKAVQVGRNNSGFGPDVLVDLLQAHSEAGNTDKMDQVANQLSTMFKNGQDGFLPHVCRAISLLGRQAYAEAQESLRQAAAQLGEGRLAWRSGVRFLEAVVRLPPDLENYCGPAWIQQLSMRFVRTHQDVEQLTAMTRKREQLAQTIRDAYAELQVTNDEAVALTKDKKRVQAAMLLYEQAQRTLNERLGMNACSLLLQQGDPESIAKVREMLHWLPLEHERVQGFQRALLKLGNASSEAEVIKD
ncbi:response regulator [Vogesella sp. LIG4]|uniref:response regulator n=1 Tax=Vogesella sp. LIG4 TaxID=1192162 RepID=UPI00081FDFF1|nr:response regulator [Vogesella sp. LIG4]SCK13549.1 DNA-binding response regulator, NarL/FixJ family, contains REC and HTH domains [Vogesella sp. LIG4]